jgi:hypothetical protein
MRSSEDKKNRGFGLATHAPCEKGIKKGKRTSYTSEAVLPVTV